ncbi:A24 family peptidase [Ferroacidibacillus organovorans]|uniref:Prepilin type IV endopeptidase peptidase domain-containing protein n=1 Tax=Ferroacidibacillus organovorans TaxID=1765683 RepID=A0A1V4ETY6_9BACL|nr:prepilin peptidase [Ferroacidibacillus organovorans]OPG16395.1 hypothetical protein B2M26_05820 [Ferroacidibacillus organovorans]
MNAEVLLTLTACTIASVTDLRARRIPNWLTGGFALFAIFIGMFLDRSFLSMVEGGFLGFCALFLPYVLRGMGAGDVKLLSAVGLAVGISGMAYVLVGMAVTGAFLALVIHANIPRVSAGLGNPIATDPLLRESFAPSKPSIPYAFAITGGVLLWCVTDFTR